MKSLTLTVVVLMLFANLVSSSICSKFPPTSYTEAAKKYPEFKGALNELKKHPIATWYVDSGADHIDDPSSACITDIQVIVVYGLLGKDCCASFSGGGTNKNAFDYKVWIQSLATRVGKRKVIYILEPDAIGLLSSYPCAAQNGYQANLQVAKKLLSFNSNAQIYVDVSSWLFSQRLFLFLNPLGNVSGIAINTSNYRSTANMSNTCETYSKARCLHCVFDTSRNYNGSPISEWCDAKSGGIDIPPTANTSNHLVDYYYLWLKVPGQSDGEGTSRESDALTGPPTGQFFPQTFELL
uniref:Secreted protein n=1 Tax=Thraustotheca clavata TaxID=74557 RepID=A0A0A7CLF9_9STRA|nr:secreted protein [Thraustotheca clavata]